MGMVSTTATPTKCSYCGGEIQLPGSYVATFDGQAFHNGCAPLRHSPLSHERAVTVAHDAMLLLLGQKPVTHSAEYVLACLRRAVRGSRPIDASDKE